MILAHHPRRIQLAGSLGLLVLGLLAITIPFWIWPLDLAFQNQFFDAAEGWATGENWFWTFLYHFGTLPAILLAISAVIAFVLSFRSEKMLPWRKVSAYLVLCMAIGPGIIVNLTFKDHFGRPRPREVIEFGGEQPHERVWMFDASVPGNPGKSFPCGHCSMGFYFFAVALVLGGIRRRWAWIAFWLALISGILIGLARVTQGGHFLSDVIWAGGFCALVSVALFFLLKLDLALRYEAKSGDEGRKIPIWVKVAASVVILWAVAAVLVATPYSKTQTWPIPEGTGERMELSLVLAGNQHMLTVDFAASGEIQTVASGHGLPGSAIKETWTAKSDGSEDYFQLKQRRSGWFSEIDAGTLAQLPGRPGFIKVVVESGNLTIDFGGLDARQKWKVEMRDPESELTIRHSEKSRDLVELITNRLR